MTERQPGEHLEDTTSEGGKRSCSGRCDHPEGADHRTQHLKAPSGERPPKQKRYYHGWDKVGRVRCHRSCPSCMLPISQQSQVQNVFYPDLLMWKLGHTGTKGHRAQIQTYILQNTQNTSYTKPHTHSI